MSDAGRPALSRDLILRTALEIVDRGGPEKLTMRRLGSELGVDPMAVYHYVPNKAALFDGITEVIWGSIDLDGIDTEGTWQQQLAAVMHALCDALRAHPRVIAILGTRSVTGPEFFTLLDRFLGLLVAAGMPADADAADLMNILVTYTVGHVLAEVGEPVGGESEEDSYLWLRPESYPHLVAVLNSGWSHNPERQYARGLHALIDGWRGPPASPGARTGESAG